MTDEEFYGSAYPCLKDAEKILLKLVSKYQEMEKKKKITSIEKCQSRIKSADSMTAKLNRMGFEATLDSALHQVYDAIGIRIICGFVDDVYQVADWLSKQPEIEIIAKKDYIAYPKPNGYRSYHLQIKMKTNTTLNLFAEIQIRTMAIDFWATLEHQLKYKKDIAHEALIRSELKRCADEIAATDLSMQTIRDFIEGSNKYNL